MNNPNNSTNNTAPLVTVCIIPRESFNMTADVAKRIFEVTTIPFKMIIMEGHGPQKYRNQIKEAVKGRDNCKVVWSRKWKFPHEFVNEAIPMIDTKYAAFVDNDVEVLEGWLENLVEAAERLNVGCVHPVYLTVKLSDPHRNIHIAAGKWYKEKRGDKWLIDTIATYSGVELADYPYTELHESDYFEWHTVMFRKDLMDRVGPLNDMTIAEHMDYALRIQALGEKIMIVPRAVVAYDYGRVWELRGADRKYLLWRWNVDRAIKSQEQMFERWKLDPESGVRRIHFAREHTNKVRSMSVPRRIVNKLRRMVGFGNIPVYTAPRPRVAADEVQAAHLRSVGKVSERSYERKKENVLGKIKIG